MTQPDDRSARNKIEHFRISAPTSQKRIYRTFTTPAASIGLCDLGCRNTKPERRGLRATRGPAARVRSKEGLAGIRGLCPKVYGTNQALRNVFCRMGQSITPRSSMNMMRSLTSRAWSRVDPLPAQGPEEPIGLSPPKCGSGGRKKRPGARRRRNSAKKRLRTRIYCAGAGLGEASYAHTGKVWPS